VTSWEIILRLVDLLRWPVLVGASVLALRTHLGRLLDRAEEIGGRAAGIEFSAKLRQQEVAIEEAAEQAAAADGVLLSYLTDGSSDEARAPIDRDQVEKLATETDERRREEIKELITQSVQYGFLAAKQGMQRLPYPVIKWSPSGAARIAFHTSDPDEARALSD
jgi:hypothetical protein